MRRAISWTELVGLRVGVWGARVEGAANLRRLSVLGVPPVAVVDDGVEGVVEGQRVLGAAGGGLDALASCDVVVKSPGISRHSQQVAALEEEGVAVTGGLALWLADHAGEEVVCVTGSKGKSTTTAVAGHLAAGLGRRPFVGGNIGRPPWDPAAPEPPGGADLWIVETSSFQAADVARSPRVVVVTSLSPDHLDWHGDLATYYADKLSLCSQPGAELTVANGDDPVLRARAGGLGPAQRWVSLAEGGSAWVEGLGLLGEHNRRNALLAAAALDAIGVEGAAEAERLAAAARGFVGLPSRLDPIGVLGGVTFVDDSLSTNVLPTLAALDVFAGRRVALLVGGHDRGIDYRPLADGLLAREEPTLVLGLPDNGERILAAVRAESAESVTGSAVARGGKEPGATAVAAPRGVRRGGPLELRSAPELARAVEEGWAWARPDGVVLLSPAAASFGRYGDYRERSAAFAAAVEGLRRRGV